MHLLSHTPGSYDRKCEGTEWHVAGSDSWGLQKADDRRSPDRNQELDQGRNPGTGQRQAEWYTVKQI